jgi:hypothetical protein
MRIHSLIGLFASAALLASLAMPCWAADEGGRNGQQAQGESGKTAKPQPQSGPTTPQAPQRWVSDCPGCASTLGGGGRVGPFRTVEECREKVAKLVAQGYPFGFCRLEQ